MFTDIWTKHSKFDSTIQDKLKEKCQRETKFGRVANLTLWLLFKLVKKAKKLRNDNQSLMRVLLGRRSSTQVLFSSTQAAKHLVEAKCSHKKLLFIGEDSLSQCKRYRIEAKIEMLKQLGYEIYFFSCWSQTELAKANLPFCETILFYRVPLFENWKSFAQTAKIHGSRIIWEIDDLVFNPEVYAEHPYMKQCSEKERAELLNGARLFASFIDFADEIIVSTEELRKEIILATEKPVHVIENAIDVELLNTMPHIPGRPTESDQILIGYGSGTLTHDADLEVAAPAIAEIMQKYLHVRFILLGHLKQPEILKQFGERVQQIPFVPAAQYFQLLARLDICIAPLVKSRFNEVKSNIKFLEAATLGVPCIASPSSPFKKAIDSGSTGFLATNHAEWVSALERLVLSRDLRLQIAERARRSAVDSYHPDVIRDLQLKRFLNDLRLIKGNPSPASEERPAKLRLGIVNVFFSPQSFGGATIVAEELASRLAQSNHWNVSVFAGNTFDDLSDYELKVFEWHKTPVYSVRLPRESTQKLEYCNETMQPIFANYLDTVRPDVLHIHCVQHLGAGLLAEASKRNIPVALTLHDAWWICPRQFRYIHEKKMNCPYTVQNPITCGS